jgi:aspartokinase-like uncharacterized kinase
MRFAATASTSRNEVPRSFAVVLTAEPYSARVIDTWLSAIATAVTSDVSVSVAVTSASSEKIVNATDVPGID